MVHPQANREANVTNRALLLGIKKSKAKGSWINELHHVLYAYYMMPIVPTKKTPFSLDFRIEAMILIELRVSSIWAMNFDKQIDLKK